MATTRRVFLGLTTTAAALAVLPSVRLQPQPQPRPRLTKARMAELFGDIECWDDRVNRLWLNPVDVADLVPVFGLDLYDREYNRPPRELLGIDGYLWGAVVFEDPYMPAGYVGMAGSSEDHLEMAPRIRRLDSSWVNELRSFKGCLMASRLLDEVSFDIEVMGVHRAELVPKGIVAHTYEIRGRKQHFIRTYDHALTDQQVIDGVIEQLMGRAEAGGGILGQMAAQDHKGKVYPMWLFRTSVLNYRIVQQPTGSWARLLRIDHTDLDFRGLIEAGAVGLVV